MISAWFPSAEHPYSHLIDTLKDGKIKFFNPQKFNDPRYGEFRKSFLNQNVLFVRSLYFLFFIITSFLLPCVDKLPLSIRVLLEAAIRNCDGFYTKEDDVQSILEWRQQQNIAEVPFIPARVLLQDFTWVWLGSCQHQLLCLPICCLLYLRLVWICFNSGIPAMVDLAAMRDVVAKHGVDPNLVNPKCPTDLIVDHSLQIDYSKWCVCLYVFHSFFLATLLKYLKP